MSEYSSDSEEDGSSFFDENSCHDDPLLLIGCVEESVSLLLSRLSDPSISDDNKLIVKKKIIHLMIKIEEGRNSDSSSFVDEFRDHVDREISRNEVRQFFISNLDSPAQTDFAMLEDLEDRILSLVRELRDPGTTLNQLPFTEHLINSALLELREINSKSLPVFKTKIEELDEIVKKVFLEMQKNAFPYISSKLHDSSPTPDSLEGDHGSLHLDKLFKEIN